MFALLYVLNVESDNSKSVVHRFSAEAPAFTDPSVGVKAHARCVRLAGLASHQILPVHIVALILQLPRSGLEKPSYIP